MQFSKSFIRQVADATDLVDLISDHGVTLKRAGSSYKGLCPFHSEKSPSFNVNPERGFFHCFGCSVSGDGIKFLMQYDRLSFSEAVEDLAKRAGIPLEIQPGGPRSFNPEEDRGLHCLKEAAAFYSEKLSISEGENAVKYLQQRQVPESMWKQFQLGMSPDEWQGTLSYLQKIDISLAEMSRTGLIKVSEKSAKHYDTFRGRLMFPVKDVRGRCIGFGARAMKPEDKPKYLNSPETSYYRKSQVLYGLHEGLTSIRKKRRLIFVEGYLDVIRLHENGFTEAVAPCGTALTQEHFKIALRYADTVILLFDGDSAGNNAALRHAHLLLPVALESYILTLPEGEDPDTFFLNNGKENFDAFLNQKVPALDYLVQQTIKKYPDSIQGRMQGLDELLPALYEIQDPKRRQLTLMTIGERMKIPPELLSKELKRKGNKSLHKNKNNDIVLGVPSSGLHSNGFSLVRHILKKNKFNLIKNLPLMIKNELIKPTKIYVNEINALNKKKLINGCANITGGGLINNLIRVIPKNLCININLSNIKTLKIFKWLKKNNISDSEMLNTFNCGIGFCLIANKNNIKKIEKIFTKKYKPYQIGYISKNKLQFKKYGKLQW